MPNYCDYEMKLKGSKRSIQRVINCLKADYNYNEGKPAHKHFFRVFEVSYDNTDFIKNSDGTYTLWVCGYCAWSVSSCMLSGNFSYYNSVLEAHPDIFMGTDLYEQSRDLEIEVFSEETGMGFSEHYFFKNGECLIDESCEIGSVGYNEKGNLTTDIDWDTYDGDILPDNPYRLGYDEPFRWCLQ